MISNEQLTVEVAKLCGWTIEDGCRLTDPAGRYVGELGCAFDEFTDVLPDFAHDLNAMHRAYRQLIYGDYELSKRFFRAVAEVVNEETATADNCMFDSCSVLEIGCCCLNATARQRAIGLLQVMDPQLKLLPEGRQPTKQEQIDAIMDPQVVGGEFLRVYQPI